VRGLELEGYETRKGRGSSNGRGYAHTSPIKKRDPCEKVDYPQEKGWAGGGSESICVCFLRDAGGLGVAVPRAEKVSGLPSLL